MKRYATIPRPEVASVEDRSIPGPRGPIRIRIYRPDQADGHPVLAFFHGSGFVICSIDTHDGLCRQMCRRAHAVVVSVDYGLAPEAPFPSGPDDALAATRWIIANGADIGCDPTRLAVVGDSAGGAMAAVTALRLRDAGDVAPRAQLLMYPVTNYPDPEPASYRTHGVGLGLTAGAMRYFWGHYLANPRDGANPLASPLRAPSLAGLPPAYVMTAEYDPLRDEGTAYAARLAAAGVDTQLVHYPDMNHGFMSWVGVVDRADDALDAACTWLAGKV
jgi:acetyl esterase